jgi:hypothetical protein
VYAILRGRMRYAGRANGAGFLGESRRKAFPTNCPAQKHLPTIVVTENLPALYPRE